MLELRFEVRQTNFSELAFTSGTKSAHFTACLVRQNDRNVVSESCKNHMLKSKLCYVAAAPKQARTVMASVAPRTAARCH